MIKIIQGATPIVIVRLVDEMDNESPLTGKTATMRISKAGGAFAVPSGNVVEVSAGGAANANGFYAITLAAGDTDTVGPLALSVWASDDSSNVYADVPFYIEAAHEVTITDVVTTAGNIIADHVLRRRVVTAADSAYGDALVTDDATLMDSIQAVAGKVALDASVDEFYIYDPDGSTIRITLNKTRAAGPTTPYISQAPAT